MENISAARGGGQTLPLHGSCFMVTTVGRFHTAVERATAGGYCDGVSCDSSDTVNCGGVSCYSPDTANWWYSGHFPDTADCDDIPAISLIQPTVMIFRPFPWYSQLMIFRPFLWYSQVCRGVSCESPDTASCPGRTLKQCEKFVSVTWVSVTWPS
jgi:hypothetical protein